MILGTLFWCFGKYNKLHFVHLVFQAALHKANSLHIEATKFCNGVEPEDIFYILMLVCLCFFLDMPQQGTFSDTMTLFDLVRSFMNNSAAITQLLLVLLL